MTTPRNPSPSPANAPVREVHVANEDPMPVSVVDHQDHDSPAQSEARKTQASTRVDASILRVEDQRAISRIWERTQQVIALSVVELTLVVVALLVVTPALATLLGQNVPEPAVTAATAGMIFLASVANLVIGFYFGRTNHTRVGGSVSAQEEAIGR